MMGNELSEAIQKRIATETATKIIGELSQEEMHDLLRPAVIRVIQDVTSNYKVRTVIEEAIAEKAKEYITHPDIQAFVEAKSELLVKTAIQGLYKEMTYYMSRALRWDNVADEMNKIFQKMNK